MIEISLTKQIHIYSVDTSAFYSDEEANEQKKLNRLYSIRNSIRIKNFKMSKMKEKEDDDNLINALDKLMQLNDTLVSRCNVLIKKIKEKIYVSFQRTREQQSVRVMRDDAFHDRNIISVFDSVLTRTMNLEIGELTEDIIIVQVYFFDVLKDLVVNGFTLRGEKYVFFTASAGQIRTKKTVFIKESALNKHMDSLTCGLTLDRINSKGGMNKNKYLAYLALCNSATNPWKGFDINKSIVVDDFETFVNTEVDYIDDKTYTIDRRVMDVPIPHMDGCGIMCSDRTNFMVRLPWVKGLMAYFDFHRFVEIANKRNPEVRHELVTDIYGKEHDIFAEDIQYIFTKSQFKMWKYYESWDEYKELYNRYHCEAGKCNEEPEDFMYAKLNYQMLQTLSDASNQELEKLTRKSRNAILKITQDRRIMLRALGVVPGHLDKNHYQQALEIYPELLNDAYSKEIIKEVKSSLVKKSRAGKLMIDSKYTFVIPDLYAFCEWLFLGIDNPDGLLKDGEVTCRLYKNKRRLDCLRSPHLYREHAVRRNLCTRDKLKWFTTMGIYTSCKDPISKLLQFDNDGDTLLVTPDETLLKLAERNMMGIVPLYYSMAKAGACMLNNEALYDGLVSAYVSGNIGPISNDITKIWNSDEIDLDAIKLLCMETNFTIDAAKTLYKPTRTKQAKKKITKHTKNKAPHFFIYAKQKPEDKVEPTNDCVVNRLERFIPNPRLRFKDNNVGPFDYKNLMNNTEVDITTEVAKKIIETYNKEDLHKRFVLNKLNFLYIYKEIRLKILNICNDEDYVTDVLIEYLYGTRPTNMKVCFWECFGDTAVMNLKRNVDQTDMLCERCGHRMKKDKNLTPIQQKYCEKCKEEFASK